jgi:hypothetical protein
MATLLLVLILAFARPTLGQGKGGGQECPTAGNFNGSASYIGKNPSAAPLRGNVACVDASGLAIRPIAGGQDATNVYGPMEAGFTRQQWSCLGNDEVSGGIDTMLAEAIIEYKCNGDIGGTVLDFCGGHARPYHYHEKMSCLYTSDAATGHSTRFATALDGNGVYGHYIDGGVEPTDLDVCGGRFGVTPDSNGVEVYYYMIQQDAPFSIGCFGPVDTVAECRSLYSTCDGEVETVTTDWGTGDYDLDCPCYDKNQSNVPGQGRPGFLPPL